MQNTTRRYAASLLVATLGLIAGCGGGGSGGDDAPATKLAFSDQPASANTGASLGTIIVDIQDASGNRVTSATDNVTLAIGTNPGGASLSGTVSVAAVAGRATFAGISLNNAGTGYTLTASSPGLSAATSSAFNVTVPAAATNMIKQGGDGTGTSGVTVTTRPSVKVTDAAGGAVAGISVTFVVTSGNGHATGTTQLTNSAGVATVGSWMLGQPGANTISASSGGLPTQTFTVTAAAPVSNYDIDLRYVGTTPAAAVQTAFTNAVTRWREVVIGDIPDVGTGTAAGPGSCGEASFPDTRNTTIDDIIIYAEIKPIDGAGQILGQAKPCFSYQGKTVLGYMKFDSADLDAMIANGSLNEVIVHEMGHVLGLGTLWEPLLTRYPGSTGQPAATDTGWIRTTDVRWTGAAGNNWHGVATGTGNAPIENCAAGVPAGCGPGTWLGHWREITYKNELMTGYISATGNPLSRVTIAALADMGYSVNLGAADAYTIPVSASFRGVAPEGVALNELPYTGPIIEIDREGRVVRRIQ